MLFLSAPIIWSSGQMLLAGLSPSQKNVRVPGPGGGGCRSAGTTWTLPFLFFSLKIDPSLDYGLASES